MECITHGSTFSGIGAPEVAAEMLGWENVFHCEINPFGRKVLDYYFTKAKSYEDITRTDFSEWRDRITVLTGGFPCQPFSYAGKRRGSEDDRYLWPFMLRCIEQVRPRWFVGENVAGITTMAFPSTPSKVGSETNLFGETSEIYEQRQQLVLNEIIQSLEGIGYTVQPFIIPACAVGAPHIRPRVFIVAHSDCDRGGEVHEHLQPEFANGMQSQRIGREHDATDSNGELLGTRNDCGEQDWKSSYRVEPYDCETTQGRPKDAWREFPSVKPAIRGRDDGFSFPVDSLTIPLTKWREQALKAYGNAIVPQVMYEIFRCIDEIEQIY